MAVKTKKKARKTAGPRKAPAVKKAAPAGSAVIPCLRYRDAPAAIAFLCKVFGFRKQLVVPGPDNTVAHAQLTLGTGMIMLGSVRANDGQGDWGARIKQPTDIDGYETQSPYVVVKGIDAHYKRAKAAGVRMLMELTPQDYGGKLYTCFDLEGRLWSFGSYDPWA